jgi:hypothetical protein
VASLKHLAFHLGIFEQGLQGLATLAANVQRQNLYELARNVDGGADNRYLVVFAFVMWAFA